MTAILRRSAPVGPAQAILYARVSSREQAEGFSLDAQTTLLKEYAQRKGLHVVREFTEAETARKAGRTAFKQMLDYVRANPQVKTILVEKTDRLYRNFHDYVALDFEALGVEVHLVKESEVLSKDSRSHQKFVHAIKLVLAKNYCDNLSEEVVKGLEAKARKGLWPTYAPIGYRNVACDHTIEPDPIEAPLVRQLFEDAASGTYTLERLRKKLYADGLRSRRAKRILSKEEVRRILANPVYMGEFVWKQKTYVGTYEPLVSAELFLRAHDAMARRARPRVTKHNFAFTGLMTCGHCGSAITAELKKGRYVYYRCARQCDGVTYVPESKLSVQLGAPLRRIALTPEIVEWTREALVGSHEQQTEYHRAALARLQARRQKVTSYLDQAYTDRLEGRIPEDVWERRSAEWERERDEIAAQIDAHEKAKGNYLAAGVKLLELAQVAYSLYVSQPPHEQRRLVDVVLSNCRLRDGTIEYDLRKPFDLLVDVHDFAIWRGGRDLKERPPA